MTAQEIQQEMVAGETAEELAARTDVKARAWAKAAGMKDKAAGMSGQMRQSDLVRRRWPLAVAVAGAVLIGSVLVRRRRKH